jgi:spoIIIJ-associated protein
MAREVETSAATVAEATEIALDELGLNEDEVTVTVINEGKSGVFGLGASEAIVLVKALVDDGDGEPDKPDMVSNDDTEVVREILGGLLEALDLDATISVHESQSEILSGMIFDISGDDLGILIGRRGQTLAALQYITRLMVSHRLKMRLPVHIDVEGYRQRQNEKLEELAERIARQVVSQQESYTMRPMPPVERRIIHVTLSDYPGVGTESTGTGESRQVVVFPEGGNNY